MLSPVAFVLAAGLALGGAPNAEPAPAQPAGARDANYQRLVDQVSPALVAVKFILKTDGGPFGGGDEEMEVTGTMIEPDGLVLVSNTEMGGFMARFGGMGGPAPTPTDIKVLVGEDMEGVKARLVSRDTELDLAWIKTEKAPEKPYAIVDVTAGSSPALGDVLYGVSRTGRFMDRAPLIVEGRLSGVARKPRHLLLGGALFAGQFGCPVFDGAGKFVGLSTLVMPEADEMEGMGGGMFGGMRDMAAGTILPAEEVAAATRRAKEHADSPGAEAPGDSAGDPMKEE